jgi:hypothetical protein
MVQLLLEVVAVEQELIIEFMQVVNNSQAAEVPVVEEMETEELAAVAVEQETLAAVVAELVTTTKADIMAEVPVVQVL